MGYTVVIVVVSTNKVHAEVVAWVITIASESHISFLVYD